MGKKPSDKIQDEFLKYLHSGRDEMNLLEHSISGANKNPDKEVRSLEFARDAIDPESGDTIVRSWEMSFSAKYGRPTTRDDDVFVTLLKLTAETDFSEPKIFFTRYQICQILDWDICGKSYKAIDDAFNRMRGVHINARKYWYDNVAKSWVTRKFGVIDDVYLYEREEFDKARKATGETPKSWFEWSNVMQESFDAGYVRKLDLEAYRSIDNPVARKLFRYLGKHFWRSNKVTVELDELCIEKLGYKKGTPLRELRRKIKPAIAELQDKGHYGLTHEFKTSYGKCDVVFNQRKVQAKKRKEPAHPLLEKLLEIGVSRSDSLAAIDSRSVGRISEDIEDVEFRAANGLVKKSKHGLLSTMLKSEEPWPRPEGFVGSAEKKKRSAVARQRQEQREAEQRERDDASVKKSEQDKQLVAEFLKSLPTKAAKKEFEEKAVQAESFLGKQYRANQEQGGEMFEMYRQTILLIAVQREHVSN